MSRKICIQTEIRDKLILKDTLKEMGFDFTENRDVIEMNRAYHNLSINTESGKVSYDDANAGEFNKITTQYTVNFYKDKALKEGNQLVQETTSDGKIVLRIS